MNLLSRYIAREFVKYFLVFLVGAVTITSIGNLFNQLGKAFSSFEQFINFIKETVLLWPGLLELVIPITILLATITTFSALNRTSEIVAMRTAGVSHFQLAKPILGISILIALFSYFNQNYLHAWLQKQWGPVETALTLPPLWKIGANSIYYFGIRRTPPEVENISIFSWQSAPYRMTQRTVIEEGQLQSKGWHFKEVLQRKFHTDTSTVGKVSELVIEEKAFPIVPFEKTIDPHHYPLIALYQNILQLQEEGQNVTKHWVEFHQKLAYPFTLFIMALIGLALSLSHSRQGKAAEGLAISLLLGVLFWISNQIFLAIGGAGSIWPILAVWSPNLIFFLLALFFMRFYRS